MKQLIRDSLIRIVPTFYSRLKALRTRCLAYRALIADRASYLHSTGWMESQKRGYPCREDGSELPWMNFPIIRFLEQRLNKEISLFEFGSGYSTLFYARLVHSVVSVEHDEKWHEIISAKIPGNAKVIFKTQDVNGDYCRSICEPSGQVYDVVVVDGRDRINCIKQSITQLSPKGVILLDDSHREGYSEGILHARENGFLTFDFEGLTPWGSTVSRSTIIYRPGNCFGI